MPEEIQKHREGEHHPQQKTDEKTLPFMINAWRRYSFLRISLKLTFVIALLFATSGILPRWMTVLIVSGYGFIYAFGELIHKRQEISNPQYWIGICVFIVLIFGTAAYLILHDNSTQYTVKGVMTYDSASMSMDSTRFVMNKSILRARLTAELDKTIHLPDEQHLEIIWLVSNSPDTPADSVKIAFRVSDREMPSDTLKDFQLPFNVETIGGRVQNVSYAHPSFYPIGNIRNRKDITDGKPLYCGVKIAYSDIFHERHHTYEQICITKSLMISKPHPPND